MQHHHHFGWGDAHISTSLYKPRNTEAFENRAEAVEKLPGKMDSVNYCAKVKSQYDTISKCPTLMVKKPNAALLATSDN